MKIKINNSLEIETKHSINKIAELIRDRIMDLSNDNIINWKNVWCVLEIK